MTATTSPGAAPPRSMTGFLDDSPSYVRPILFAVGGLALLSLVRIIAGAPDLTAGDTFIAAIGAMSPIVFAALGGLYAERVGVVNIGLEGMMILGTWFAGWAGWHWGPYAAIVGGVVFGALGRPAPGPRHGHLRRRSHRRRHRHQPAGARRHPLPLEPDLRRRRRREHHAVAPHDGDHRPLHVPVPRRRQPVRLADAGHPRLAGRQAMVPHLGRRRPRPGLHAPASPSPRSWRSSCCRSRPTSSGARRSASASGRSVRSRQPPTPSVSRCTG